MAYIQGGDGRLPIAENLRRTIDFEGFPNLLRRYGRTFIINICVGIGRSNKHGKRQYQKFTQSIQFTEVSGEMI